MDPRLEEITTSDKYAFPTVNYETAKYISSFSLWVHKNTSNLATFCTK